MTNPAVKDEWAAALAGNITPTTVAVDEALRSFIAKEPNSPHMDLGEVAITVLSKLLGMDADALEDHVDGLCQDYHPGEYPPIDDRDHDAIALERRLGL